MQNSSTTAKDAANRDDIRIVLDHVVKAKALKLGLQSHEVRAIIHDLTRM